MLKPIPLGRCGAEGIGCEEEDFQRILFSSKIYRSSYSLLLGSMGIKDLFITPIFLVLLSILAYFVRPYVTNDRTRKYFFPALWVRFAGAIALGLIYQFYYSGGDTFNYWQHGSTWIWQAFMDDPSVGWRILLGPAGEHIGEGFQYTSRIWYFRDPKSFFVVRLVAIGDLLTFNTYSATALLFASFSFSGLWAMYSSLESKLRNTKWLAIAILFIPSTVFWGSGILKDTITFGALGWLTWACFDMLEKGRRDLLRIAVGMLAILLIAKVKVYILICFFPALGIWMYLKNLSAIRNKLIRMLFAPIILMIILFAGFEAVNTATADTLYALDSIAQRAAITAYDIRYGWGARTGETSGYDLGILDGTWQSMIRLMPEAINVTLFRPYLWEVQNPLMLLSAVESLFILFLVIWVVVWKRRVNGFGRPFVVFCLIYSLLFAFAVGVSTYNFGTLMRYKIPLMVMFLVPFVTDFRRLER